MPTSKHTPRLQGAAGANAAGRGNKAIMDAPDNVAAPSAAALMTASGALPASQVGADDGRRAAGGRQEQEALPAPMLRPAAEPMVLPVSVLASPSTMCTRSRARAHTHTHTHTHTRTHARTHAQASMRALANAYSAEDLSRAEEDLSASAEGRLPRCMDNLYLLSVSLSLCLCLCPCLCFCFCLCPCLCRSLLFSLSLWFRLPLSVGVD